ncbi:Shikimate dehydrogenase (NADP(+)) [uncultured archaeon]|nr:Shikimate dehydrogenase (NADP(+)) [uncultured archaeon]
MICVSLIGPTVRDCLAQLKEVSLAEIRMDLISDLDEGGVKKIFSSPVKLIATCRPKDKENKQQNARREQLLLLAISGGAAFVDIELESPAEMRRRVAEAAKKAGCKVIVSHHDFEKTPMRQELAGIKARCLEEGADVAKLACMARSEEDVQRMLDLCDPRTVAIAMGPMGVEARAKIVSLGSPFTFAAFDEKSAAAPGQVGRERMEKMMQETGKAARDGKTTENGEHPASRTPILLAVSGNPVHHSQSPALHNAGLASLGIEGAYFRLLGGDAAEVLRTARAMGLRGLSVTSPFKEEMAHLVHELNGAARELGAANTVVLEKGKAVGYNTDGLGVSGPLAAAGVSLSGARAVVVGSGGAAKAAVLALQKAGASVVMANRTVAKIEAFAKKFGCETCTLEPAELGPKLAQASILVSCTSTHERFIEPSLLHSELAVLDAHYTKPTALVADAKAAGCKIVSAQDWLLYQGLEAFRLFTKREAPAEAMRQGVLSAQQAGPKQANKIALIGMMGCGKSAVGKRLTDGAGLRLVEMDAEIERKAGRRVAEIFEKEGEAKFRQMESALLSELAGRKDKFVVSCGGGVVLDERNVELLQTHFYTVWLWADEEDILARVGSKTSRPLLNRPDKREAVRRLLEERKVRYASACDLAISTQNRTPKKIAEMIAHEIGLAN